MPNICLNCVGDEDLRRQLKSHVAQMDCDYCGRRRRGLSIQDLARLIFDPLREAYGFGGEAVAFAPDSDKVWYEQKGETLTDILQMELEIEPEPAEALAAALADADPADPSDGEEPFIDDSQLYERVEISGWEYADLWWEFSQRIKHRRRFFDDGAVGDLERLLGAPGSSQANDLPAVVIGPETPYQRVFRARRAKGADHARSVLDAPERELFAPPPGSAVSGRMNPTGISVFYGALSEKVAVAEVRPAVGGIVLVGTFSLTRQVRLLDLTKLGHTVAGTIFAPGYVDRVSRLQFLRSFHRLIAQPVQPHDESLEYVPTQAVAEYVCRVLKFDGILYASAQTGSVELLEEDELLSEDDDISGNNVVLLAEALQRDDQGRLRVVLPVAYDAGSARGVWITSVAYTHTSIDLSDERGDPLGWYRNEL